VQPPTLSSCISGQAFGDGHPGARLRLATASLIETTRRSLDQNTLKDNASSARATATHPKPYWREGSTARTRCLYRAMPATLPKGSWRASTARHFSRHKTTLRSNAGARDSQSDYRNEGAPGVRVRRGVMWEPHREGVGRMECLATQLASGRRPLRAPRQSFGIDRL
jgi:hypothetical protein